MIQMAIEANYEDFQPTVGVDANRRVALHVSVERGPLAPSIVGSDLCYITDAIVVKASEHGQPTVGIARDGQSRGRVAVTSDRAAFGGPIRPAAVWRCLPDVVQTAIVAAAECL